ncbi:hypothetical protein [Ochrobactrum sp. BTU1]|uniref:hypothetical protein n=1 Tax=Ochrobactrum sp. BTU1 TaxID=2840456 RepID=UPI001C0488D9|nr:hypothetical protein KMS41_05005 [Ochrobactrum sp. BTU1]
MANETYKKNPKFMSPKGTAVYPKLTEPDYGTAEYPKPDGEYSVKLRMSKDEAEAFLDTKGSDGRTLRQVHEEAVEAAQVEFDKLDMAKKKKLEKQDIKGPKAHPIYSEVLDKETGEETGDVEFKFKKKASGVRKKDNKKWTAKPDLFDAKGNKLGKGVSIWGGSTLKVNFEASNFLVNGSWLVGLTLFLNAAQVIDLVSNGQRDASGYGFEAEEGYEYDPEDYREEDNSSSEGGSEGNDDNGPADGDEDF